MIYWDENGRAFDRLGDYRRAQTKGCKVIQFKSAILMPWKDVINLDYKGLIHSVLHQ
jgi:hypothetical protein